MKYKRLSIYSYDRIKSRINPSPRLVVPVEIKHYNDLRCHVVHGDKDGVDALGYADDIHLLLMQKNFEKVNSMEYRNWLKEFTMNQSTLKQSSKPKMSDDQLLSFIKSRHCQSASEVSSWMTYLSKQFELVKDTADKAKSQLDELRTPAPASDPDPAPSPTPKTE